MMSDRRAKSRPPLTPQQQSLLTGCEWIIGTVVGRLVPPAVLRSQGRDEFEAAAWYGLVKAASDWRPDGGSPFTSFGWSGAYFAVRSVLQERWRKACVWAELPTTAEGWSPEPADFRAPVIHPALHHWCSDDYTDQRRCLDWRGRIILYLRAVEGWTLEEVADILGVTRERVRSLQERDTARLAAYRRRRQIRRQLVTGRAAE